MDKSGDLISDKGEWADYGILRRDKDDLRLLTQLVTGHANLGYHRYLMNIEYSPNCDCGEVKTTVHHITEARNKTRYPRYYLWDNRGDILWR